MDYEEIFIYIPGQYVRLIQTPLGEMIAIADDQRLYALQFLDYAHLKNLLSKLTPLLKGTTFGSKILDQTERELHEYFMRERKIFTIPFGLAGTPFQQKAWNTLQDIPYGTAISYKDEAQRMENPKAIRAVGSANGKNPIIILIPCHRVVQTSKTGKTLLLGGYSNGIERKKRLLELEGVI